MYDLVYVLLLLQYIKKIHQKDLLLFMAAILN